jgi:RNA polymerase sigma-70 factor (ECF subfamily)
MAHVEQQRFEAIFRRHYDDVLRFALARAEAEVAKDAAADTFLVAWRRSTDVPERPLPWLLAVTRRTLADQRRSLRRRARVTDRLVHHRLNTTVTDPADLVTERAAVIEALIELRPRDREVLELVAWDGLAAADAAVVIGCSPGAFAVRLSRARGRFAAALAAHEAAGSEPCATASPVRETR